MTYTLTATNYAGEPVEAEIGVALTDAAALAISYNNAAGLLPFFYSQVGTSFRTGTPLTINTDQISQQILDVIKGGGGMALLFNFDVRDDFVATTYWNAFLATNAEGKATFDVTLPDNLTTWRLDARAITNAADGNMLVGQTTYDLTSTLPLLIRPVTPRFLVMNDEIEFAAVANNNTDEAVHATVLLEAEGIRLLNDADHAQAVVVPARGSVRVNWRATVLNVAGVELVFAVESDDKRYQDASRPTLGEGDNHIIPVYRYEVAETVATGGMMTEEGFRTETIQLPETMTIENGELILRLETSLAASTTDALTYLENYHDLSIPGVVNRLLPNLMTFRALNRLNLSDEKLAQRLDAELDYALQRLYNEQRADGGWGWYWRENSDVTTTAYALLALAETQAQGFYVDPETILRAQSFLSNYLIVPDLTQPNYLLNRQAFVLYVLGESGKSDVARLSNLYEQRGRLNLDAQIFLTLALHRANSTQRMDTLLNDIVSKGRIVATGFHWSESYIDRWNWSSDTRTTALGLKMMILLDPESELIPQIVRWLMIARKDVYWTTTQETAWSLMALTDWMSISGELQPNFSYQVRFNNTSLLVEDATPETLRDTEILTLQVADLLAQNALRIERGEGDGVLYYNTHLRLFVPVPDVKALDRGIIIQRQYSLLYDEDETPITEAKPGDLIRVRLTIVAPQSLHYLTVIDPLPAGAEAIDPTLAISPRFDTYSTFSREEAYWYGWGWWYFQQREFRDEEVRLNVSYLPAGTYQFTYTLRAGLPGVYNVIPAQAYEEYFLEVFGRTEGMAFTILPEE